LAPAAEGDGDAVVSGEVGYYLAVGSGRTAPEVEEYEGGGDSREIGGGDLKGG